MKANNIKALDYEHQGAALVLILYGTTLEEVIGMDAALVEIRTDEGDLVEVFAGYALRSVTYDTAAQTYTAKLTTEASGSTAEALSKMAEELAGTQSEVAVLAESVETVAGEKAQRVMAAAIYVSGQMAAGIPITDDDQRLRAAELFPDWALGAHKTGEIYNAMGQTWECYAAYDTAEHPDVNPGSESWYTFNRPLHGKTPETARPWVAPTHAEDRYRTGEYMIWTDGQIYPCIRDTSYSPDNDPGAWGVPIGGETPAMLNILDGMTVAQLKEYAANNNINTTGLTLKADIRAAIEAAEAQNKEG